MFSVRLMGVSPYVQMGCWIKVDPALTLFTQHWASSTGCIIWVQPVVLLELLLEVFTRAQTLKQVR